MNRDLGLAVRCYKCQQIFHTGNLSDSIQEAKMTIRCVHCEKYNTIYVKVTPAEPVIDQPPTKPIP